MDNKQSKINTDLLLYAKEKKWDEIISQIKIGNNNIEIPFLQSVGEMGCLIGVTKSLYEGYKELHHHNTP